MGVINLHDAALMCPNIMTTVIIMTKVTHTPTPGCSTIQLDILACCHGNTLLHHTTQPPTCGLIMSYKIIFTTSIMLCVLLL